MFAIALTVSLLGLTPGSPPPCTHSQLRVTRGRSQGTLGQLHWPIRFRNVSAKVCTLRGYPGVSSMSAQNGRRIGVPASRDTTRPVRRIRLAAAGGIASAVFTQTNVGVFEPNTCHPKTAAGLRVYPPNHTSWFYLPLRHRACSTFSGGSDSSVRAVVAGSTGL